MRSVMCIIVALGLNPTLVVASDLVEFSADAGMSSCSIVDAASGIVQIHMFYVSSEPGDAVLFHAPTPACWVGATWLGDVIAPGLTAINNTHYEDGVSINNLCNASAYLGYMNFFMMGQGSSCCNYPVLPPPGYAQVLILNCDSNTFRSGESGDGVTINPDSTCPCQFPVATEETTWGRVKSLYR